MAKRELIEVDIDVAGEEPASLTGNAMVMSIMDDEKLGTVVVGKVTNHDTRVKLLASSVAGILKTIRNPEDYMAVIVNGVIEGFKSHAQSHGVSDEDLKRLEESLLDMFDMQLNEEPKDHTPGGIKQ